MQNGSAEQVNLSGDHSPDGNTGSLRSKEDWRSAQNSLHYARFLDTGEFLIQPEKRERKPSVVDTQLVQDRGIEVPNMNGILNHVVAEVISRAVRDAAFDSAAGHPRGEAARMMIAAIVTFSQLTLTKSRPTKLATENNQRVIQHPALFQVA